MFLFQAGILDNLDKILAREIELGNFANVTEDTFRLPRTACPTSSQCPRYPGPQWLHPQSQEALVPYPM